MPIYNSAEELNEVALPFFEELFHGPLRHRFAAIGGLIRVVYTEPDAVFLLDTRVDPPTVSTGAEAAAAGDVEVEMRMTSDDGHLLWIGRLNLPKAVAQRRVTVNGPLMRIMGMLPAFKPAFAQYRAYLERTGRSELLNV